MTDEKKKEFQRRLSSCNRGEMIVIIYDVFFEHADTARKALECADKEGFRTAVRNCDAVLVELQETLNFDYDLAKTLFPMYQYVREQLALSLIKNDDSGLNGSEHHMRKLYDAFVKVAAEDTSAPIMQNVESVTVGMTYGRGTLNESLTTESNRGFLA